MKKFYLLAAAALLAASSANAKSITLYNNDEVVASGSTLVFTEVECIDYSEYGMGVQYLFEPKLAYEISETGDISVEATVVELEADVISGSGAITYSNCGGFQCVNLEGLGTVTSPYPNLQANSRKDMQQHFGMGDMSTEVTSEPKMYCKSEVTIYYTNSPSDKATLTLIFDNTGTHSVAGVEVDSNAPVKYYNLQGMEVNSDTLTPGIYVRRQGTKSEKVFLK